MGRLTLFWTDALVYLLVAMVAGFIWYVGSREHLRRPWRQIVGDKVAMVSLLVLMAFSGIGLLDSVHFYPAVEEGKGGNEAISLFDWWATPMRTHDEKTYSRPFAAVSYSREFLVRPDGSQGWEYPRLAHGGAHLRDPDVERGPDIARTVADGFVKGGLLWAVCAAGLCGWLTVRGGRSWWRTLWDVAEDRTETLGGPCWRLCCCCCPAVGRWRNLAPATMCWGPTRSARTFSTRASRVFVPAW